MKSKSSGILPDDTDYDCFHNGGEFICGRKRKTYAGDTSLLSIKCEADFSGKSPGFFSFQYDGGPDLFCRYDDRAGNRSIFHHGQVDHAGGRLDCDSVPSITVHLTDYSDTDRKGIGKSSECRRIPAGCGFPYRSADSARCRSVRGSHAAECMDTAGTGSAVCSAGMGVAAEGSGEVHL